MSMDCSVIIVNYNTRRLTADCIRSIRQHSAGFTYEIIVVDNASTDGSVADLEAMEDIVLIHAGGNRGFGVANNMGAAVAKGRFLFFLNSDTVLNGNVLGTLLSVYRTEAARHNMGVLGPLMTDSAGKPVNSGGRFPSVLTYLRAYLGKEVPVFDLTVGPGLHNIDFVTGAGMLMEKVIFDLVGGFDEGFFLYYEETDLQKRLYDKGFRHYLLTSSSIVHLEGGSDGGPSDISNFKRTTIHRSRNRYLWKHDSAYLLFVLVDAFATLGRLLRSDYTWRERLSFTAAVFKSYLNHA